MISKLDNYLLPRASKGAKHSRQTRRRFSGTSAFFYTLSC